MAKALGIIGNIKGKVGNVVGYNLTDSNNKQTQGLRVYQPNVKNPKTAAQAEQRAKLAPINATYRALKMIIDRGNEGLPYGNKSRLAWLKEAFNATHMPWYEKGAVVGYPVGCALTKGSLSPLSYQVMSDCIEIDCSGMTDSTPVNTVGAISTAILAGIPQVKAGDQLTFVMCANVNGSLAVDIKSIVIDPTSSEAVKNFSASASKLIWEGQFGGQAAAIIVSREGANGEHLRSTTALIINTGALEEAPYDATSKTAAIESYMASGSANTDWAEDSIQ